MYLLLGTSIDLNESACCYAGKETANAQLSSYNNSPSLPSLVKTSLDQYRDWGKPVRIFWWVSRQSPKWFGNVHRIMTFFSYLPQLNDCLAPLGVGQDEATCLAKPMDHFIATGSRGQFGAADYVLRSKRSRWVSLFGRYFFDLLRDKKIIRSNQWSRKRSPFNNKE